MGEYITSENRREYTGKIYEADFLGMVKLPPEFFEAERRLPRGPRGWYRNDNDIFELAKKFYPEDPTNPKKELGRELRLEVIDALGFRPEEYDNVKFFTTVGIEQIDKKLGVDAFIEYTDPKSKRTKRVTIDLTQNQQKVLEGHKADIIIGELPAPEFEEEKYQEEIENIASKIASKLVKSGQDN